MKKVMKFGGSSVGTAERIKKVIEIVERSQSGKDVCVVVFSAYQGITDELIKAAKTASLGNKAYLDIFQSIKARHLDTAKSLVYGKKKIKVLNEINSILKELEGVLKGVYLVKELTAKMLDYVMSFGERLSAFTINSALVARGRGAFYLDTREYIKTDKSFGNAKVIFADTNKNIRNIIDKGPGIIVATGFIASTKDNETSTLGRGGSDYSASVIGAAAGAEIIEIWTDVDGVLTSDPRKVKSAFSLTSLTYEEAMELSHFGAKVIYPPTMQPALESNIPIVIKNTFNPEHPGTLIGTYSEKKDYFIKGLSSIDKISLLLLQGIGMVGVSGIASRLFGALAKEKINVILITQASSEHSICLAVLPNQELRAKEAIEEEFRLEIFEGKINPVKIEQNLSIIAIVGEKMKNTPGLAGKVFNALGKNKINIVAIAQGSTELNISLVVSAKDEANALSVLHKEFFENDSEKYHLYLAGTGLIGSTLLKQIYKQRKSILEKSGVELEITGLINQNKMLINKDGISETACCSFLNIKKGKSNLSDFINQIKSNKTNNKIFIDCTASDEVAESYKSLLENGISVVTANKKANVKSNSAYEELRRIVCNNRTHFLYETNVGAGLPVIEVIQNLVLSGDRIRKIEGIFSGTMNYIFNEYKNDKKFYEVIFEAKRKGFTEPDPREDLKGTDVARKLLILVRESGYQMELKDVNIEKLFPEDIFKSKSLNAFYKKLNQIEPFLRSKREKAERRSKLLKYIAKFENGLAQVKLMEVDYNNSFYSTRGSENVIIIYSDYYSENPLVIKGPGAGADVTSAGVFGDILKIAKRGN